jgi:hypothetical protein
MAVRPLTNTGSTCHRRVRVASSAVHLSTRHAPSNITRGGASFAPACPDRGLAANGRSHFTSQPSGHRGFAMDWAASTEAGGKLACHRVGYRNALATRLLRLQRGRAKRRSQWWILRHALMLVPRITSFASVSLSADCHRLRWRCDGGTDPERHRAQPVSCGPSLVAESSAVLLAVGLGLASGQPRADRFG